MADLYCVYEHVFPNGKKYIGISSDAEKRWRNGKGYKEQAKVFKAIKKYAWDNIKHNIILDDLTKEQAEAIEKYLIAELNTIDNGYNVSTGGENIVAYYLDDYVLKMIWYVRKRLRIGNVYPIEFNGGERISIIDIIEDGKTDKAVAEFANQATSDIIKKHRKYKTTNEDDVLCFWFHMREYYLLSVNINAGVNVENWEEEKCPFERIKV